MIAKKVLLVLVVLSMFSAVGCQKLINERVELIDPDVVGLAKPIREALLKNKKLILSIGTGLCENCKIVEETLKEFEKEKPTDLEITIFTDYTDVKTFEILKVTISPTTFLINENHEVKRGIIGPFTADELKRYLKEIGFIKTKAP